MNIERPTQILVRRRAALGDVIMSTGVVRELKHRYPDADIDVITEHVDVYRDNPHVRRVLNAAVVAVDPAAYDVYVNLDDCYEHNPLNHYLDSYFYRAFGNNTLDHSVELFDSDEDRAHILNLQHSNQLDQYIVVHMRNWHWELKNMNIQTWFDVYAYVFEHTEGLRVVCVGSDADHYIDLPMFVDARGQYTPQQLKVLIAGAQCFVGTDSGPYHCAAATDTPIIALLTHLKPERIVPYRHGEYGWRTTAISADIDCVGCNDRQVRPVNQIICERGNMPCKDSFNSLTIADAILKTL
jgi:ADP-heptose:LPS heptosyltransferase